MPSSIDRHLHCLVPEHLVGYRRCGYKECHYNEKLLYSLAMQDGDSFFCESHLSRPSLGEYTHDRDKVVLGLKSGRCLFCESASHCSQCTCKMLYAC